MTNMHKKKVKKNLKKNLIEVKIRRLTKHEKKHEKKPEKKPERPSPKGVQKGAAKGEAVRRPQKEGEKKVNQEAAGAAPWLPVRAGGPLPAQTGIAARTIQVFHQVFFHPPDQNFKFFFMFPNQL